MSQSPRAPGAGKPSSEAPPVTSISEMKRLVEQREAGGSGAASESGGVEGAMLRRQQYTLHPTLYTLNPYPINPKTNTLKPKPYTLN